MGKRFPPDGSIEVLAFTLAGIAGSPVVAGIMYKMIYTVSTIIVLVILNLPQILFCFLCNQSGQDPVII